MKVISIYGPPGTGKTTTLMDIAARATQKVLCLSYTKAAAQEITSRSQEYADVRASTLHSLAFQRLGLGRGSVVDFRKLVEFGLSSGISFKGSDNVQDGKQEGDEYIDVHSYARNRIISDSDAYEIFGRPGTPKRFQMCIEAYEQWKQTYGYMDFDDMLIKASKAKFSAVPIVILDEAQDCSPLQWSMFERVCEGAKEVFIAGDDDQAIYEWGGANPHGMQAYGDRYAAEAKVLALSHRLPLEVHKRAVSLIEEVKNRVPKAFAPQDRKGYIERWGDFGHLLLHVKRAWRDPNVKDVLILTRDNFRLRELQTELNDAEVPYALATVNGPYENRYAKALRGYLRDTVPSDEEREAMLSIAQPVALPLIRDRNWKAMRAFPWSRVFDMPPRQKDFYADLNERLLFEPLKIKLSTIHQAKGGEAEVVILDLTMTPRVEAGIDLNPDAERRVWYVGMTRAKNGLHLCGDNPLI